MAAQIPGVGQLDHLIQGVFDDGVGKTGGNVLEGRPLLLSLLHVGVHKYGAAGAQIDGIGGKESLLGELGGGVAQGIGKVFKEGAAAGGAGLIQENGVYGVVPDFDAFHVLTADVQNAVHLRIEEGGGLVVGDGLHLPLVQAEGGLQQGLAVAGGAGAENFSLRRQLLLQLTHGPDGGLDGRALIARVEGPQELPLLADQSQLGGGGPGVDAQVAISPVALQRGGLYPGPAVAGLEDAIFLLTLEEGR